MEKVCTHDEHQHSFYTLVFNCNFGLRPQLSSPVPRWRLPTPDPVSPLLSSVTEFLKTPLLLSVVCTESTMACCLSREADSSNTSSSPKLHLITYLCPDFPLELFQTYQRCLEEALSCESYLIVESRWAAPPAGKIDPFTANEVDIGKTSASCIRR